VGLPDAATNVLQGLLLGVPLAVLGGALRVSTPFLFVSLGECLTERSGRVNLGLEGTLVMGAMAGFGTSYLTGSAWLGVIAAGLVGASFGAVHGWLCGHPRVNDIAVGIALMLFGLGLAFFLGKPLIKPVAPKLGAIDLGSWSDHPSVRAALRVTPLLFVGVLLALGLRALLARTRWGLVLRTVGESADTARAMGYDVNRVRLVATIAGRVPRGRGWLVPVPLLPRELERGPVERAGPDGGGARHLRALAAAAVPVGLAALWRSRGAPARLAVRGRHVGVLSISCGPLRPHIDHHDLHQLRRADACGAARRAARRALSPPAASEPILEGAPTMSTHFVVSDPYAWPFDGDLPRDNTALIVIDMQTDFCGEGGYIQLLGYDISNTRASIGPIKRLLEAMRAKGYPILHTREGHRPYLANLPANKRWRSER
jgi:hypothetical protein